MATRLASDYLKNTGHGLYGPLNVTKVTNQTRLPAPGFQGPGAGSGCQDAAATGSPSSISAASSPRIVCALGWPTLQRALMARTEGTMPASSSAANTTSGASGGSTASRSQLPSPGTDYWPAHARANRLRSHIPTHVGRAQAKDIVDASVVEGALSREHLSSAQTTTT